MSDNDWLAARFEEHRGHLHAVAYRMLGSDADAEDVVQNSWLRLSGTDSAEVANLGGWLTTVVSRECLHVLRARRTHREQPFPEPAAGLVDPDEGHDPEAAALLADHVGPALMVVLDTLGPGERVAFVLHDVFAVPFDQIAPILERSPAATRQLASRARRRVRGGSPACRSDLARQRRVVDAFLAALTDGDLAGLIAVLDPDVTLRDDSAAPTAAAAGLLRGAQAVGSHAAGYSWGARFTRPALVEGTIGLALVTPRGELLGALGFAINKDRITRIEVISDPDRLHHVNLTALDD